MGHVIVRALHGRAGGRVGLQQCSRAATTAVQSRVLVVCRGWAIGTIHDFPPIRTGQSISSCGTPPRGLPGYSSPPAHGWGRFHQPRLRAATQGKDKQAGRLAGLLLLLLRPPGWGPFRAGGGRCCVYAMRCGARARALKLSLGPHAAVAILVLGRSEYWVATQTTESRR